jgi:acyl-CoA synthetase (NDP forming)
MPIDLKKLDRALNPRTVAVVGDSGRRGYNWLNSMKTAAKLYSVQLDENEIPGIEEMGIPNYKSLMEIPDDIDYVLVTVPRKVAPIVLKDCIAKQVGGAAFFTSGFAETDTEEGKELQSTITQMAQEAGLVLIGPNCMGLYNPAAGVRFAPRQPVGFEGPVTFVSQSGSHAGDFAMSAHAAGIQINKVVSFGNGIVLENADYLEYFTQDPQTKYLAMYIEGLRDGRRFFDLLREATQRKPIILMKGGMTAAGKRATASHTASLAGSAEVWEAMCRQAGAIQARSIAEVIDLLKAVTMLPPFTGDRMGLTGGAGGQSVSMTDAFSLAGLTVPTLTEASYSKMSEWFSLVGASYRNPIDMGSNRREIQTIMDILTDDDNVDCITMQLRPGPSGIDANPEAQLSALTECKSRSNKPFAVILSTSDPVQEAVRVKELEDHLHGLNIPTFPSYDRAAQAIRKVRDYYRFRDGVD